MPPERRPPDDPREWLSRAHSHLVRAQATLPGDLCFDAQQAAEKAIKAVLLARGVAFPPIHDLVGLLTILGQTGEAMCGCGAPDSNCGHHALSGRLRLLQPSTHAVPMLVHGEQKGPKWP